MEPIQFHYKDSCRITLQELENSNKTLIPEIKNVQHALTTMYESDYASINLPTDIHLLNHVKAVINEKKGLKPTVLIVIGIGGSNLGTLAIHEAINGKLYNEKNQGIKVYWADTVDTANISTIQEFIEHRLQQNENIILNIISKSGTTTETIANAQIFLETVKKHRPDDYFQYVVVATDKDSKLWNLAQEEKFECFEIPALVGGRYSVFSAVGLFPLGMLGVDIDALVSGARSIIPECTDENIADNPAASSAAILAHQYKNGKNIHDTFLFSPNLESLGKWYRQLLGESIGKEYDREGKKVNVNIFPTVSIGSTDLHSVGQLYLTGPKELFTTFVDTLSFESIIGVPYMDGYDQLVENIQGKFLATIMDSIREGVQNAYRKRSLPYVTFLLPAIDEFYLGQFLQCKMIETMYLGYLLNINPFDQPNVELYKEETRQILKNYKNFFERTDI